MCYPNIIIFRVFLFALMTILARTIAYGAPTESVDLPTSPSASRVQMVSTPKFHIETRFVRRVRYTMNYHFEASGFMPKEWRIFAMVLPELPSQKNVTSTIKVQGIDSVPVLRQEASPLKRSYLFFSVPAVNGICPTVNNHSIVYEADMYSRKLVAGPPASPIPPLSAKERADNLAPTRILNFNSPEFQDWLDKKDLRRKPGESECDFVLRASKICFATMKDCDSGNYMDGCKATNVLKAGGSSCGGFGTLFASICRANNIPAAIRFGRFAQTTKPDPWVHVTSDFFAEGIGWINYEWGGVCDGHLHSFEDACF